MPRGASRELVLNQREWPKKSTADSTAVGKGVTLCPGACAPIPPNALHSLGTAASAWGALGCLQQVCVWVAGSLPSSCKRLALTASPGLPGGSKEQEQILEKVEQMEPSRWPGDSLWWDRSLSLSLLFWNLAEAPGEV